MKRIMLTMFLVMSAAFCLVGCEQRSHEERFSVLEESFEEEFLEEKISEEVISDSKAVEQAGSADVFASRKSPEDDTVVSETIFVHVCGAVRKPGVYELNANSRVFEAVAKAGGFTEAADENYVNQAVCLQDGIKLCIPTREEVESGAFTADAMVVSDKASSAQQGDTANQADARININTATESQLCNIPGVGATRAAAIAAYRDLHGGFAKEEDIMQVSGIKQGTYDKIKEYICVQ